MLNTFDLILFGGTGDLSTRKLLPALFRQETVSSIDSDSNIICVGTKDLSQDDYIEIAKDSLNKHFPAFEENKDSWSRFKKESLIKSLISNQMKIGVLLVLLIMKESLSFI